MENHGNPSHLRRPVRDWFGDLLADPSRLLSVPGAQIRNPKSEIPNPLSPLSAHEHWMRLALAEARQAFDEDEVPVGAIVVHQERVIAAAYNQRETLNDPTAHAEMIAITQAAEP